MRKQIHVIYSFGGNKNFGDDYILSEWIRYSHDMGFPKKLLVSTDSTWLQSYHFDQDAVFNSALAGMAGHFAQQRKRSSFADRPMPIREYIKAGIEAADHLWDHYPSWRQVIQRVSAFHACGGGYVNSIFPGAYSALALMSALAKRMDVPLFGSGLGLMPMESGVQELDDLFASFEVLECRDTQSFEFIKANYSGSAVTLGCDDTFLTPVRLAPQPIRPAALFVNIQSDLNANLQALVIERIRSIFEGLQDQVEVKYLHFFDAADRPFFSRLKNIAPDAVSYTKDQLYDGGLPFQKGDFCISSRFHCHMLAARSGVKGAYVSARPGYYDIKHNSVQELGSGWLNLLEDGVSTDLLTNSPEPRINEIKLRRKKEAIAKQILSA